MSAPTVYIATADGEQALADKLAGPLRAAGYEVTHDGTLTVGESPVALAARILEAGSPIVLCATRRSVGSAWTHKVINAARGAAAHVFIVQMEPQAYVEQLALRAKVARYYDDSDQAINELLVALAKHFPLQEAAPEIRSAPPDSRSEFLDQPTDAVVDIETLTRFRRDLREEIAERFPSALTIREFLDRAGLRTDGRLTRTGGLLFAEDPTVVNPTAMVKCARYFGADQSSAREVTTFEGTVPDQIIAARKFVADRARIGEAPSRSQAQSADIYEYPMVAVREIIANALVHRDYTITDACVHIRLFPDRLEVTSPGTWLGRYLKEGVDNDLAALVGQSVKRNFRLAHILSWIRLVEGEGSGVPSALHDCRSMGTATPTVVQAQGFITVKLQKQTSNGGDSALVTARGEVGSVLPGHDLAVARVALPRDISSFTGRMGELEQLMQALENTAPRGSVVGIHAIDGMAGVGKTALAVHAAHMLAPRFPDGQIFLSLHAHTPGQRPVEPSDALASLLMAIGLAPQQIPADVEARTGLWRERMAGRKALLLLDDAVGSEQVRPLLPSTGGTLVLITSRRRLTALPEALAVSLDILQASAAAQLFVRLAGRGGPYPGDDAVAKVVALCGYLPLAISLMAGQLTHHPAWTVADLADELTRATDRLATLAAENISVAASFELSYRNLPADQQRLFRRLGLHPGTDVDAYAAAALTETDPVTARRLLDDLFGSHLIDEPTRGRYRFHNLIREYARAMATGDPPEERAAAIDRLLEYYLLVARVADRYLALHAYTRGSSVPGESRVHIPDLSTREQAITWMDAERLNLHAAAEYATAHNRVSYATAIPAAMHSFLRSQGHWDQALALHQTALKAAGHANDAPAEANALIDLGDMQQLTGSYPAATASLTRALDLHREIGNRPGEANALSNLGTVYQVVGDYAAASASLTQALELYRNLGHRLGEAETLGQLGVLQYLTADFSAATGSLTRALDLRREIGNRPGEANALSNLGTVYQVVGDYAAASASLTQALELYRNLGHRLGEAETLGQLGAVQHMTGDYAAASASLTQALELYRNLGSRLGEAEALGQLGAVQHMTGDYAAASASLTQALELYRNLGSRLGEAETLGQLGAVQHMTGDYAAASASLTQALELCRNLGDPLGEAETLNNMGELALASASPSEALVHHERALVIAVDIAAPHEEARALEGIGRSHLHASQPHEAAASLRKALAIYERIGSPQSERVAAALRAHGQ